MNGNDVQIYFLFGSEEDDQFCIQPFYSIHSQRLFTWLKVI